MISGKDKHIDCDLFKGTVHSNIKVLMWFKRQCPKIQSADDTLRMNQTIEHSHWGVVGSVQMVIMANIIL